MPNPIPSPEAGEARKRTPLKIAQTNFHEWCSYHKSVVDVMMAADLVKRIEAAIKQERDGGLEIRQARK